ncbi:MAG: HAD-IA family hydrolase [Alphaproteobacteria bacterium]|nr:HAD-IA family hydrolase [Alphaproteobacteria bacterium]
MADPVAPDMVETWCREAWHALGIATQGLDTIQIWLPVVVPAVAFFAGRWGWRRLQEQRAADAGPPPFDDPREVETLLREVNACGVLGAQATGEQGTVGVVHAVRRDGMPHVRKDAALRLHSYFEEGEAALPSAEDVGALHTWIRRRQVIDVALRQKVRLRVNATDGLGLDDDWHRPDKTEIACLDTEFAVVRAARLFGLRPPVLSAGAIVFCPEDRTLLLQRRGAHVDTYPSCHHLLGGNYEPHDGFSPRDDVQQPALRNTAIREIEEESGVRLTDTGTALVLTSTETTTGFRQLYYAGLAVTMAQKQELRARAASHQVSYIGEGEWDFVPLAWLVEQVRGGRQDEPFRFVPSGAMLLLAWLGMGAPDQHRNTPMRQAALDAYRQMRPRIHEVFGDRRAEVPALDRSTTARNTRTSGWTTVLLDAGGVLIGPDWSRAARVLADHGLEVDADALRAEEAWGARALDAADDLTDDLARWRHLVGTTLARAAQHLGPALRDKAVDLLRAEHERHHLWREVYPDVRPALDRLARHRITLGVLSNSNGSVEEVLTEVGLRSCFLDVVDSGVVGIEKPDPRAFRGAVERLGVPRREVVYVGDLTLTDVAAARRAGIDALLLDRSGSLTGRSDALSSLEAVVDRVLGTA